MMEAFVPKTMEELLPIIDNDNKRIAAGCTDIMVALRAGKLKPKQLIDINSLKEIKVIDEKEDKVFIGSNLSLCEILNSEIMNREFPLLIDAVKTIGSPQIRSRGTLGGNIQNASPSGDSILALNLLGASVLVTSITGKRVIAIDEFITGVGKTCLRRNEFIEAIIIPKLRGNYRNYFEKVGLRRAMVISVASIGILYKVSNNIIEDIKIACGAVAAKVVRMKRAEDFLKGKELTYENLLKASGLISEDVMPIDDVRGQANYRKKVCGNLILRLSEK